MIRALLHVVRPTRLRASMAALLVVLVGTACNSTDVTDPTAVGTPGSTTDAASATATPAPTLASLSFSGIPYGPTGLWDNYTALNAGAGVFNGSQAPLDASGVLTLISSARTKGQRLVLAMTGGPSTNYTTGGKFDMTKWQKKMNTFNTATIRNAIAGAVSDGTIVGNSMIDEPETARWGGNISKATIDAMATYAKGMFPTMPEGINIGPPAYKTWRSSETFKKLDWVRYQYNWWITEGNVNAWRDGVLAQARKDGVAPAFGINVLDGGLKDKSGAWDCPGLGKGTYAPNCNMTPDQVRTYGKTLAAAGGCLIFMWRYDNVYITKSTNQTAFKDVATAANAAPRRSCKRP